MSLTANILILSLLLYCTILSQGFSKDAIQRHINFLGSDLFEGRGTGTTGGNLAAKYIALEFEKLNLIPVGDNNTYYQYIPMHGSLPLKSSELMLYTEDQPVKLKFGDDYLLYKSGDQTYVPYPVPLVFAGYGIIAPEFDYNDYEYIDVEGKIVVMLDGEPQSDDAKYFDGKAGTVYSYAESKQRMALSRGARGSIIIPISYDEISWEKRKLEFSSEDITLAYAVTSHLSLLLNPKFVDKVFAGSSITFPDVIEWHENSRMRSFKLHSRISFKGEFARRDFLAPNIIGMISGKTNVDSYLIISAHYDHLGIGEPVNGDSVYNGVFDNALGVAVVLELVKVLGQNNFLNRSIIFLLITGEEKGLLGSAYYTDHPVVPLYKTIANINIDGVPVIDRFKSIVGVGSELSTIIEQLKKTADEFKLNIKDLPAEFSQTESFNRSDQIAFAKAGIPSLLVVDAPDYENISKEEGIAKIIDYSENYYHTPFDDLNLPINYDAVNQYCEFMFNFIIDLANSDTEPQWNEGVPYSVARLRTIAERK